MIKGSCLFVSRVEVPSKTSGPLFRLPRLKLLDKLHMDDRYPEKPLRVPVLDRYNDRGTMVLGKVEQVSPALGPQSCSLKL